MTRIQQLFRKLHIAALPLGIAIVALAWTAPASATTLMIEDGDVLSDKWNVTPGNGVTPELVEGGYSVAANMGAKMIRYHRGFSPWENTATGWRENLPRAYDLYWHRVDSWLPDVERRGFEPYLTLVYQPDFWKMPTTIAETADFVADFGSFCSNVAARYDGRIDKFAVWNEPNNNVFGRGFDNNPGLEVQPQLYNTLYRTCFNAVRAQIPNAEVFYGEIDAHKANSCNYVYDSLWQPTLTHGIAIHTYQWTTPPEQMIPGSSSCQGIGRLADWNVARNSWFGNGNYLRTPSVTVPQLLITEHGYCSPVGECVVSDHSNSLSEATRADYTRRAFLWAQSKGVTVFSYYHLFKNRDADANPNQWDTGIVHRVNGAGQLVSPTLSAFSLRTATGGHGLLPAESDVNGDGLADLVTLRPDGKAYVYAGRYTETFNNGVISFADANGVGTMNPAQYDGNGWYVIDVSDVTGDKRADMVTLHSNGTAYVYPGTTTGAFAPRAESFAGTMTPALLSPGGHEPIAAADVTGDGKSDLVTFADTFGNVFVYPGRADGTFGPSASSFAGTMNSALHDGDGHYFVDVSDMTGDGRADLVTLHSTGVALVYPGRADGTFAPGVESFRSPAGVGTMEPAMVDGSGHEPVGLADVNGDRRTDLVTVSNGTIFVYRGQASGAFAVATGSFGGTMPSTTFGATPAFEIAGVLDVNGDGRADLLTAHTNGNVLVYRGLPNGTFQFPPGSTFAGSFRSTQHNQNQDASGNELVSEKPFWRRRGCPSGGCH